MRLATIMNKIKEFFKRIKELDKKDKLFIKIMCCLLALQILFCALDLAIYFTNKNNVANAEYSDLSSDTLVNFNQILQFSATSLTWQGLTISHDGYNVNVVGTSSFTSGDSNIYGFFSNFNVVEGKKYYFSSTSEYWQIFTYGQGSSSTSLNKSIFTATSTGSANLTLRPFVQSHIANGSVLNDSFYVYIICLSDMFGIGNEPNLEEAQEYFTADYYPYNTGTPIPYSKDYLQGYNDGANAVYEALTITYNDYMIGSNSTSYGNNVIEKGEIIYDSNYGAYMFSGVIGIDLLQDITAGTNININFDLYIPDLQGESGDYYKNFKLTFAYIDNNNNLTNIATIEPVKSTDVYENLYTGTIILPLTTRYLYMYVDFARVGQNESPTQIFSYKSSMSFRSLDVGLLMKNSYLKGQQAGEQKYAYGSDGYNNIYNLGFANGSNNSANGSIFTNGWTWVGMIFHEIGDILSIQLLPGIPISLFVALPLLVGLLFFIVKITKGSGG